jgi:hypothetical protein
MKFCEKYVVRWNGWGFETEDAEIVVVRKESIAYLLPSSSSFCFLPRSSLRNVTTMAHLLILRKILLSSN